MANSELRPCRRKHTPGVFILLVAANLLTAALTQPASTAQDTTKPSPPSETVLITKVESLRVSPPTPDPGVLFDRQVKFYDFTLKAVLGFLTLIGVAFTVLGILGLRDIREVKKSAVATATEMVEELKLRIGSMVSEFRTDAEKQRADFTDRLNEQAGKLVTLASQIEAETRLEAAAICSRVKSQAESRVSAAADALVVETRGRLARAEEDLKSMLQPPPPTSAPEQPTSREKRALELVNQAYQFRAKGEHAAAVDGYTEALRLNPASHDAYLGRGYSLIKLKKPGEAAIDFAAAARLNAKSAVAFSMWGFALDDLASLQSGTEAIATFKDACSKYQRAAEIMPDDRVAFYNWGIALGKAARLQSGTEAIATFKDACSKYQRAAELGPEDSSVFFNWGYTLDDLARLQSGTEAIATFKDACSKYQRAAELKPDDVDLLVNWGVSLTGLAHRQSGSEAIASLLDAHAKYRRAAELKPGDGRVFYNWGYSLDDLARLQSGTEAIATFKDACSKYQRATELKPDYRNAYFNWGIALTSLARRQSDPDAITSFKEAYAKFQRAAELRPDLPRVLHYSARSAARAGYGDQAFKLIGEALEAGLVTTNNVEDDADFAGLHDDPRWKPLLDKYRKKQGPPAAPPPDTDTKV